MLKVGQNYVFNEFKNLRITAIKYDCIFFKILGDNDPITFLGINDFKKVFKVKA
jgi:hypothetical protein